MNSINCSSIRKARLLIKVKTAVTAMIFVNITLVHGQELSRKQLLQKVAELEKENAILRSRLVSSKKDLVDQPPISSMPPAVSPLPAPEKHPILHPWSGNVSAGGSFDRGNTEDNNLTITGEVDRNTDKDKLLNSINGTFGRSRGTTTAERVMQATQYDDNLDDRWYSLVHQAASFDKLAGIRYREILGPGIGYYLVKNKATFFNLELGLMGEAEKLSGEETKYVPRLLLANNFEHKFSPTTRLFENAEIFPDILNPSDYHLDAHVGIETAITHPLALKFTINDLYDTRPPVNHERNDLNAVTALVWKF